MVRFTGTVADDLGQSCPVDLVVQVALRPVLCPVVPEDRDMGPDLSVWLQGLPDGTVAEFPGEYRAETPVEVSDKTGLTVRGLRLRRTQQGVIVWPTPNPHLWLLRCAGAAVEGLVVSGTNTVADQRPDFGSYKRDYEFEAALRVEQFTDVTVTGLTVDAVWGDGIQLQRGDGAHLADCAVDRNGRQGVTIIASRVLAERVHVLHSRRSGFDLEPDVSSQVVSGVEIRDCDTNTIGLAFASAGRGQVNDVWIHHNATAGSSVPVVYVASSDGSRRASWRVEDNTALQNLGSPMPAARFDLVDGVVVTRNRWPVVTTQSRLAVGLKACGGRIEVTGNDTNPGGDSYYNREPVAGQDLYLANNTPTLSQVP